MDAGRLRERVTLEQAVLTPLGGGSFARSYAVLAVAWAAVTPLPGAEDSIADRRIDRARYRVEVRAREGVREAERILWKGRVLRVVTCIEAAKGARFLLFTAEEEHGR